MSEDYDGHLLYSDSTLNHIFMAMIECIMTAGGDGCGVVVSKNYEYYASKFEEYLKATDMLGDWERTDGVGFVNYFSEPEDNMSFCSSRVEMVGGISGWEEIVVELM